MYPWRRILIPTDFSTASEWVFDDGIRIAGRTRAEIVILHIRNQERFPADPKVYEYAEQFELEKLRDRIKRANASIATRMVVKNSSEPGKEICSTAIDESADLVVMSTHARHHVAHLLVGSTTRSVITDPPAPILAIRYGIEKRTSMRRIVVPLHTKQKSHAALDLAATIAADEQGEVHLLTICNADEQARAQSLQDEASARFPRVTIKHVVVIGDDIEKELVRYTDRNDADAVFLNATDTPSPLKIDIIRHVAAPVMIVPAVA
jgi:nucleotide-binding universal stress UspA family protein